MNEKMYVPIWRWKKEGEIMSGCEFFVLHIDYAFDTEDEAHMAGIADFVFQVLYNVEFVRVEHIDLSNHPHARAELQGVNGVYKVAVVKGKVFDELMEKYNAKKDSAQ